MLKLCVVLALVLQASPPVQFDSNRAWEHLRQVVSIGPRPSGSPAIGQPALCRRGQARWVAGGTQNAPAARYDWGPQPANPPRFQLDAVVDRHRVGCRPPPEAR